MHEAVKQWNILKDCLYYYYIILVRLFICTHYIDNMFYRIVFTSPPVPGKPRPPSPHALTAYTFTPCAHDWHSHAILGSQLFVLFLPIFQVLVFRATYPWWPCASAWAEQTPFRSLLVFIPCWVLSVCLDCCPLPRETCLIWLKLNRSNEYKYLEGSLTTCPLDKTLVVDFPHLGPSQI